VNDSDFIQSAAASQIDTFALNNLSTQAAALVPVAVQVNARARNSAVAPTGMTPVVRVSGTDYFAPAPVTGLTTSFQNGFGYVWNLSPATGLPWTVSEMNGAEGGERSET